MARFYGIVGFVNDTEVARDVHVNKPIERFYKGDFPRNNRNLSSGLDINDTVSLNASISIIADPYALSHFHTIRYVKWGGGYWRVETVEVQYPRLILSIGGVYNGETADQS